MCNSSDTSFDGMMHVLENIIRGEIMNYNYFYDNFVHEFPILTNLDAVCKTWDLVSTDVETERSSRDVIQSIQRYWYFWKASSTYGNWWKSDVHVKTLTKREWRHDTGTSYKVKMMKNWISDDNLLDIDDDEYDDNDANTSDSWIMSICSNIVVVVLNACHVMMMIMNI